MRSPRLVAVVVCVVLLGCTDDGGDEPSVSNAVDAELSSGAGADLPSGFQVAEGTRLVGRPVPFLPIGTAPFGSVYAWEAFLHVDGDPKDVVAAYLRQASAKGYDAVAQGDGGTTGCGLREQNEYECYAKTFHAATSGCLEVTVRRTAARSAGRLRWVEASMGCTSVGNGLGGDAGLDCRKPYCDPDGEPPDRSGPSVPLPGPGDQLQDWPLPQGMLLPPGVRAAALPLDVREPPCGPIGVLKVTTDADQVLEKILERIQQEGQGALQPPLTDTADTRLGTWNRTSIDFAGGGDSYTVDLLRTPRHGDWLYLDRCSG